jgi:ubiquinone/menaquinone biosynthesis C-methylase UbiE
MVDFNKIYNTQGEMYETMVQYEDYEHNLLPTINNIRPIAGLDILDTGAGTGRVTELMAPHAKSIRAFDLAHNMLRVAHHKLRESDFKDWCTAVADHRHIPIADNTVDLVISAWSVCMLVVNYKETWQAQVAQTLDEMYRVLRPGGTIIIIETQGTGYETPTQGDHMKTYCDYLEDNGFDATWIRTDFKFESEAQAKQYIGFFFGKMGEELVDKYGTIVPECTGFWWKHL